MNFSREYARCEESLDRLSKEKRQTEYELTENSDELKKHLIAGTISVVAAIASIVAAIALTPAFLAVTALMGYFSFSEISGAVFSKGEVKELKDKLSYIKEDIKSTEKYQDNLIADFYANQNNKKRIISETTSATKKAEKKILDQPEM